MVQESRYKLITGNTGGGNAAKDSFGCHKASPGVQPVLTLPVACHVLFMLLSLPSKDTFYSYFGPCWFVFQSFYFLALLPSG